MRTTETQMKLALKEAEGWSEHGYSPESRAYWQGMRDTLRVLLGATGPGCDVAALWLLARGLDDEFPDDPTEHVELVADRVARALDEMQTWCGPYGFPGVAKFIDRRDAHIREAIRKATEPDPPQHETTSAPNEEGTDA